MDTVSQRDKRIFENLFVLEAANNAMAAWRRLKLIQDYGQICRQIMSRCD